VSAKGQGWTPAQRKANRAHFAKLKKAGKSAWTPERLARFQATMASINGAKRATKTAAQRPPKPKPKRPRKPKPKPARDGVDIDAGTPRSNGNGGQHFPLELIPDRAALRAAVPLRAYKARANGAGIASSSSEGARLAVAMQLLRTIERLLGPDE
jgi:hypothetical protein